MSEEQFFDAESVEVESDSSAFEEDAFEAGLNGEDSLPETLEEKPFSLEVDGKQLSYEEAVELSQKGMNIPKIESKIQQLEADPRLAFVDELAGQYGMDANALIENFSLAQQVQSIDELVQSGVSPEVAAEMVELRGWNQERLAQEETRIQQEKQQAEIDDFVSYFKDFDPNKDEIPQSVWDKTLQGTPLRYAYLEHQTAQLEAELKALKQGGTVALTQTKGSTEDAFLKGFMNF